MIANCAFHLQHCYSTGTLSHEGQGDSVSCTLPTHSQRQVLVVAEGEVAVVGKEQPE
jgi:hypothetical protein